MNKLPGDIREVQNGLVKKKFTVVDLVDLYLARVKKHEGLNAFITITDELAYSQAKKADRALAQSGKETFKKYPLLGVVVGYKDMFLTKNTRTTAGSKVLESYVPPYSSTVVERLEKAGAVTIGKLNCDAWAHGASGENSDFGPTKNPWDAERVPGGSSSGPAAAVSANLTLMAVGTDTGGSVRQPASFCGLVGLKPTYGAVSRYGVIAMASSLDSVGHITRSVEDSKKIFEIIRGEDGRDSTVKNAKYEVQAKKIKIGIPKEYFSKGLDKEVENLVLTAAEIFKGRDVEFKQVSLPHTKYGISVYYIIQPAEVSSNLARYDGIRYGNGRDSFGEEARRRIALGSYVLSSGYRDKYYLTAMKVRSKIIEDFEKVYEQVDVVLAPVSPTPAFKLGEKTGNPLEMYLADALTVNANLAGIPALAIPCGFTKSGLPIGFQLMGARFSENTLFKLGEIYQEHTDWHKKEAIS